MATLLAVCAWNIKRMYFGTDDDNIKNHKFVNNILCVYYVILALIILASMNGNETLLFYFGFLRGALSKAFFMLFCAALCFPMTESDAAYDWVNTSAGMVLVVVAILQILKVCRKEDKDNH